VSTDSDKGNSKHDQNEMKEPSKKRKSTQIQSTVEAASVEDTPSFQSFQLNPRVLKAVLNQFEQPTLVQATAIPLAVSGKDIVARAKTGSGKTIAYVLPVIHHILTNSVRSFLAVLIS
jgi:ATP-dependent RNA helicase DDX56/DBP9